MAYEINLKIEKAKEFPMTGRWPHWIYWDSFLIFLFENKPDLAVNELKIGWSYYPDARNKIESLMEAYDQNGVKGVFEWHISLYKGERDPVSMDKNINAIDIAEPYAASGNEEKALDYIDIAIKNNHANIYQIKCVVD